MVVMMSKGKPVISSPPCAVAQGKGREGKAREGKGRERERPDPRRHQRAVVDLIRVRPRGRSAMEESNTGVGGSRRDVLLDSDADARHVFVQMLLQTAAQACLSVELLCSQKEIPDASVAMAEMTEKKADNLDAFK
ncbi:hypothetical protein TRIUR3_03140 [Triticum urartu]|uniref:Uncharacterized protein n=1 Tax=Triticum urartu TaxID=4572 RepID=M8AHK6_TRIUA|nr:hypothetical protein TRIUR3_03140 [Triticum urartu]